MQRPGQDPVAKDDVPWWMKYAGRGLGTVGSISKFTRAMAHRNIYSVLIIFLFLSSFLCTCVAFSYCMCVCLYSDHCLPLLPSFLSFSFSVRTMCVCMYVCVHACIRKWIMILI